MYDDRNELKSEEGHTRFDSVRRMLSLHYRHTHFNEE
jgi:hypothetical protein